MGPLSPSDCPPTTMSCPFVELFEMRTTDGEQVAFPIVLTEVVTLVIVMGRSGMNCVAV
jgi:hypothetical protein